nr:MAG TPA: hypothetical protein [Caudoviricetes sp.]
MSLKHNPPRSFTQRIKCFSIRFSSRYISTPLVQNTKLPSPVTYPVT